MNRLLLISAGIIALGCSKPDQSRFVISDAADTAIVRGQGVPTDPDDTIGTQYQKHEAPRRVGAPACLPNGIALCIADTARTFRSGEVTEGDGGIPDERVTQWLMFAAAQDSLQVFMVPSSESYLAMTPRSAAGFFTETSQGVDASWIRARFAHAGAYVYTASISADSVVSYELRVAPVISTGASRPIGASATLTLAGDSTVHVAIAPAAMMPSLDSVSLSRFAVRAGTYRVLLVRDTSYVACRVPCLERRTFTLRSAQSVTITP